MVADGAAHGGVLGLDGLGLEQQALLESADADAAFGGGDDDHAFDGPLRG